MKYQQNQNQRGGQLRDQGSNLQNRTSQGLRPINGEILSVDDQSIIVKLSDGSSKIIILTDSTSINKTAEQPKDNLKVGEKVAVFGSQNSDGSVAAQNIQINPVFRGVSNSPNDTIQNQD